MLADFDNLRECFILMAVYLVAEYVTGVAIECQMFTLFALIEDWLIMVILPMEEITQRKIRNCAGCLVKLKITLRVGFQGSRAFLCHQNYTTSLMKNSIFTE
jgi:hypothetical protein